MYRPRTRSRCEGFATSYLSVLGFRKGIGQGLSKLSVQPASLEHEHIPPHDYHITTDIFSNNQVVISAPPGQSKPALPYSLHPLPPSHEYEDNWGF